MQNRSEECAETIRSAAERTTASAGGRAVPSAPVCRDAGSRPAVTVYTVKLTGRHVLLTEDNAVNRLMVAAILEKHGVSCQCAKNGAEGVELFARSDIHYFDAVLMDIQMPVMDGLMAAQTIRQLHRSDAKNTPIIAMTANTSAENAENCLDAGMNDLLAKPFEPEALCAILLQHIR